MKKWFKNLKIRNKLILPIITIVIIYGMVFAMTYLYRIRDEEYKAIRQSEREAISQIKNYFSELYRGILDVTSMPMADTNFLEWLEEDHYANNYKESNFLHNYLFNMVLLRDEINFIAYVDKDFEGQIYYIATDGSYEMKSYDDLVSSEIFKTYIEEKEAFNMLYFPASNTDILSRNNNDKFLFIRSIKNPKEKFQECGYLLAGINVNNLDELVSSAVDTDVMGVMIKDRYGEIVYSYGKMRDEAANNISYSDMNDYLGLKFEVYTDTSVYDSKRLKLSIMYVFIIVTCAVLVAGFIVKITTSAVTIPIYELLQSMKKMQTGDFEQHVDNKYKDETGQLIDGYNQMVEHINRLILQKYDIEISEKEAQLSALQTQINPHFLYNTLDLLYWKFMAHDDKESAKIVYSLSNLFRQSLNQGEKFITVENEIHFLEYYLYIYKLTGMEKLDYKIINKNVVPQFVMPRFLIQPIVENSLIHGLKESNYPVLEVIFEKDRENVFIKISDNGKGMSKEQYAQMFSKTYKSKKGGYAIWNIKERLALYFGEKGDIEAYTEKGKGTVVMIRLPDEVLESDGNV